MTENVQESRFHRWEIVAVATLNAEVALRRRPDEELARTPQGAEQLLATLLTEPWFTEIWGKSQLRIEDLPQEGRNGVRGRAEAGKGIIYLIPANEIGDRGVTQDPLGIRPAFALVHEMAHCLDPNWLDPREAHGAVFVRILLILWDNVFGTNARAHLEQYLISRNAAVLPAGDYAPRERHRAPCPTSPPADRNS